MYQIKQLLKYNLLAQVQAFCELQNDFFRSATCVREMSVPKVACIAQADSKPEVSQET